ncbi:MAG: macro domain-containing protein [Acidobacteria bacterium]|jgi:O-acetyl-ADP-ribose deacetylase (regulator of RNase III)|nr:macro domain-containing protein [Acidobacteriota bacterium]
MIKQVSGNILDADAEALVNTVNTVGVMGKGIALQFRQAFMDNYRAYVKACERGEVRPGEMFVYRRLTKPRWIINFPTKRDWRHPARMTDIESGLRALVETVKSEGIKSIAVPPLGCGSGGLDWNKVRSRIQAAFADLSEVSVLLYAPTGAPRPEEMKIATSRPKMTSGRAALIALIEDYALPWYRVTLLEIQKLAYFLQAAGEPLRLSFVKGKYGPYAENLHHVLQNIEGHFIRGYGDRSRAASIQLLPGAVEEARDLLASKSDTIERLHRLSSLIHGFETPYSMELLATVHWLAQQDSWAKTKADAAIAAVQAWNEHKKLTFNPKHIRTAWERLREQGWL